MAEFSLLSKGGAKVRRMTDEMVTEVVSFVESYPKRPNSTQKVSIRMDSLRRFLESYLSPVDGLSAILLSDRDGVGLLSASQPECLWAVEAVAKRGLVPGFCQAVEQANKIGMGQARVFVTNYGQLTVVLLNYSPLIVTLIGQPDCNLGAMTGLLKDRVFEEQIRRLQQVIPQESADSAGSGPVRV